MGMGTGTGTKTETDTDTETDTVTDPAPPSPAFWDAGTPWRSSIPASPEQRGRVRGKLKGCDHAARTPAACLRAGRICLSAVPVECPVSQLCRSRRDAEWSIRHNCAPDTSR